MNNIAEEFEKIASIYPSEIAVIDNENKYTYEDLNKYANYVANQLLELSDSGTKVAICMKRSFKLIAAMMAVLKAGMIYVPFDGDYPVERLKYMAEDSNAELIVCEEIMSFFECDKQIILSEEPCYDETILKKVNRSGYAYIIYTSGSTGNPKGVIVEHESVMNTLMWRIKYYNFTTKDVVLQIPSFSFSSSVEDIFSMLLSGGTLVMVQKKDLLNPKKMAMYMEKYDVTNILVVPTLYNQMIPYLYGTKLRLVVIAGERVTANLIKKHYEYLPEVDLYCEYGMSETSVSFSACLLNPDEKRCLIGKPIDNMDFYLKDKEGMIGELVAVGIGVAQGYTNCSIEDRNRFGDMNGQKTFSTGDYVGIDNDNQLVFYGRKDKQIKINGKRFDLTEIDAILQENTLVKNVVSTVWNENHIITFIESDAFSIEMAREILEKKLPKDFVPRYIEILHVFDTLPNGKIDIRKLKENFWRKKNV